MKRLFSHRSGLWIMKVVSIIIFCGSSTLSLASIMDGSNPSKLSEQDYANGFKRAEDAANRVTPKIKQKMQSSGMVFGNPVFIRVFKESRELEVWVLNSYTHKYQEYKRYKIAGMSGDLGPKQKQGDKQAPEGFYSVGRSALNPQSRFHLSFNLGYPNQYDRAYGRTGHSLMVHGNEVSAGCFAMTDFHIEEIYTVVAAALGKGQTVIPVHCFPFRMTEEKMSKEKDNQWYPFWKNLKVGYDSFEKHRVPPRARVSGKSYTF